MKLREMIDLIEARQSKKTFVGTCVNSFDEDGDCIIRELPYNDVSAFVVGIENATPIDKETFLQHAFISQDEMNERTDAEYLQDEENDVFMIYDPVADIHYFYV